MRKGNKRQPTFLMMSRIIDIFYKMSNRRRNMDLRVERTKNSIKNAFIELRSKKPLEKITVKELSELAVINRATFYSHYEDIYDLSEQIEDEILASIISDMPHPEYLIQKPKEGLEDLVSAIHSRRPLIDIVFSGNRQSIMAEKLENTVKESIFENFPEFKESLKVDIILTAVIHGYTRAFQSHRGTDLNEIIDVLSKLNESIVEMMNNN